MINPLFDFTFEMPGEPKPLARARTRIVQPTSGKAPFVQHYDPAEQDIHKGAIIDAFQKVAGKDFVPQDGPVELSMDCIFRWSKDKPQWWREAAAKREIPCHLKSDFDNLEKLIGDSLNGIAWVDDKQIFCGHIEKWWGERPHTLIKMVFYPLIKTKQDYLAAMGSATGELI